jgi:hypothetical protein
LSTQVCPNGFCTLCDTTAGTGQSTNLNFSAMAVDGVPILNCCGAHRLSSEPLCSTCAEGFISWGGSCIPCEAPNQRLLLGTIAATIALTLWLHHSSQRTSSAGLAILIYFCQTAALQLAGTSILLAWAAFVNFNPSVMLSSTSSGSGGTGTVDTTAPPHLQPDVAALPDSQCILPLDPYQQLVLNLCMPLLFLAELAIVALVHAMLVALMGMGHTSAGGNPSATGSSTSNSCCVRMQASLQRVLHALRQPFRARPYFRTAVGIVLFCYLQVASSCVKFLWCIDVQGEQRVFAEPAMNCRSAPYQELLPFVYVVLLGFVVGVPCAALLIGWRVRHTHARRSAIAPIPLLHAPIGGHDMVNAHMDELPSSLGKGAPLSPSTVQMHIVGARSEEGRTSQPLQRSSFAGLLTHSQEQNEDVKHGLPAEDHAAMVDGGIVSASVSALPCAVGLAGVSSDSVWLPLLGMYDTHAWHWAGWVLLRRTLLVVLDMALAAHWTRRAMAFGMVHLSSLLLLLQVRPYHSVRSLYFDAAAHVLLILACNLLMLHVPPLEPSVDIALFVLTVGPLALLALVKLSAWLWTAARKERGRVQEAKRTGSHSSKGVPSPRVHSG